jgi:hypothetical protein
MHAKFWTNLVWVSRHTIFFKNQPNTFLNWKCSFQVIDFKFFKSKDIMHSRIVVRTFHLQISICIFIFFNVLLSMDNCLKTWFSMNFPKWIWDHIMTIFRYLETYGCLREVDFFIFSKHECLIVVTTCDVLSYSLGHLPLHPR